MKISTKKILEDYCKKYCFMMQIKNTIWTAFEMMYQCFQNDKKILVCGNGGSNSDADHIVGELLKGFMKKRKLTIKEKEAFNQYMEYASELDETTQGSLPAINLGSQSSIITAIVNDIGGENIFAQQVYGLGKKGDILIGITTSGNSKDIINAGIIAKINQMKTIGLTGRDGGKLKEFFDCCIIVPSNSTPDIQDMHTCVYHTLCAMIENEFWEE